MMYEPFFRFERRPFSATPEASCFVALPAVQETLDQLLLCVFSGQGIAVVTAPAGIGKTQLCHKLLAELGESFVGVYLPNSHFPTSRSLLQAILYELGHPYIRMAEQELRLELTTAVKSLRAGRDASRPTRDAIVLVVDEAHLLSERSLEEIRTVTNLAEDGQPLVRVVLAGQLPLEETLTSPALAALNQRIRCQVSLDPLTRQESADYVASRLALAGADAANIFTPEALQIICHASDGSPRCLNQLCDHCLMLACVAEEKSIGAAIVREALDDLRQLPLQWNESTLSTGPVEQSPDRDRGVSSEVDDDTEESTAVHANGEVAFIEFGPSDESETTGEIFEATEVGAAEEIADPLEAVGAVRGSQSDESQIPTPEFQAPSSELQPPQAVPCERATDEIAEVTTTEEHLIGLRFADVGGPDAESVDLVAAPNVGPELHSEIQSAWDESEPVWDSVDVVVDPPGTVQVESPAADDAEVQPQGVRGTLQIPTSRGLEAAVRRNGEFEEEPVFDRYAMLDAGLPVPNRQPVAEDEPDPLPDEASADQLPTVQPGTASEQVHEQAADAVSASRELEDDILGVEDCVSIEPLTAAEQELRAFADDLLREPHPDAILDDLLPMLDDIIRPAEETETFSPAVFEAAGEEFENERTIIDRLNEASSLVAEADLLGSPTAETNADPTDFAETGEYDVVQPEVDDVPAAESDGLSSFCDAETASRNSVHSADRPEPHRPYAQLFSDLRRRRQC